MRRPRIALQSGARDASLNIPTRFPVNPRIARIFTGLRRPEYSSFE
jgi:hypothetical protein